MVRVTRLGHIGQRVVLKLFAFSVFHEVKSSGYEAPESFYPFRFQFQSHGKAGFGVRVSFREVQYLHGKGPNAIMARFIEVPANDVYVSVLVNVPDMFSKSFNQWSFGLAYIVFATCLAAEAVY